MITDLEARKIASDWHGGGGTALYALSSTGAIDTARADHDIRDELAQCINGEIEQDTPSSYRRAVEVLELRDYVRYHGTRGPVDGWSSLTW